jgi:hypothetical protein
VEMKRGMVLRDRGPALTSEPDGSGLAGAGARSSSILHRLSSERRPCFTGNWRQRRETSPRPSILKSDGSGWV